MKAQISHINLSCINIRKRSENGTDTLPPSYREKRWWTSGPHGQQGYWAGKWLNIRQNNIAVFQYDFPLDWPTNITTGTVLFLSFKIGFCKNQRFVLLSISKIQCVDVVGYPSGLPWLLCIQTYSLQYGPSGGSLVPSTLLNSPALFGDCPVLLACLRPQRVTVSQWLTFPPSPGDGFPPLTLIVYLGQGGVAGRWRVWTRAREG